MTDGDTADPALATSCIEISYNQVVGCVTTGIALAFGLNEIAHNNTVVSAGVAPDGTPYAWDWLGLCIEGDARYQPSKWLEWIQLKDNVVGVNGPGGARTDVVLWYPDLSQNYVQGQTSLHDGPITLADEQAQWTAWKSKLTTNGVKIGP